MVKHNLPKPEEVLGTGSGPIPHYPNWLYHCPDCNRSWEIDVKFSESFLERCPDCARKLREGGG